MVLKRNYQGSHSPNFLVTIHKGFAFKAWNPLHEPSTQHAFSISCYFKKQGYYTYKINVWLALYFIGKAFYLNKAFVDLDLEI